MTRTDSTSETLAGVRINGQPESPKQPWHAEVREPATGRSVTQLLGGGRTEATAALNAAAHAEQTWADTSTGARAEALRGIAASLRKETESLAVAISRETGKRIAESRAEVGLSAAFFEWFADAIRTQNGQVHSAVPGLRHEVIQRPLGIVSVLTPWNFPLSIPARKIAPALAAGCPVLFKPSEVAPTSALRLAELLEPHVPAGVINTVLGEPSEISATWLDDRRVRGLTFTGSTSVGQRLAQQTAASFTRNVLELGGNAPFVMLDNAELSRAVDLLAIAKFRNNGQSCIAAQQVWVPRKRVDEFAETFAKAADELVIGDPLDPNTTLGPLALANDPVRVDEVAHEAEASGATLLSGKNALPNEGHFARPMLCVEPAADSRATTEEVFGPLLTVREYDDIEDVLSATRADQYGLGGYVVGEPTHATHIAQSLDVGIVGVNNASPNTPQIPFGGLKHSGIGSEGGYSGLDTFQTYQTTAVGA